jgi:hypothetical protein
LIKLGQVVGKAGFLVEFNTDSKTVYPGGNAVSVQLGARFTGVKRSGRNYNSVPVQVDAS